MSFGFSSTTDDVLEGVDLSGKTAVVTGASGGLGLETARALASAGASVVLAARNPDKLDAALASVREQVPDADATTHLVDLASVDSTRASGAALAASHPRVDMLVNNAAVMACPLTRTVDGFEMQFGTNHLGHFSFTSQLAGSLGEGSRVVSLSSSGHRRDTVHLDDPNFEHREYDKWAAYGQAKTANIWFASELQRRLGSRGATALSVHPGVILTDLGRHLEPEDYKMFEERPGPPMEFKTIPQGAATSVWAATAPELVDHGGSYLEDCSVAGPTTEERPNDGYAPWAYDEAGAAALWTLSEELVGQSFG